MREVEITTKVMIKPQDAGLSVMTDIEGLTLHAKDAFERAIIHQIEVVKEEVRIHIVEELAGKFLEEKGNDIIANIDAKAIANLLQGRLALRAYESTFKGEGK